MKILFNFLFFLFLAVALFLFIILACKIYQNNDILLISAFCILISSLLASSAVMKNSAKDNVDKISNFYLDKSLIELNNIYQLLKNQNNDRVTWILVSRIILLVDELSSKIELEHHKKVFDLQKFQIQHKIRDLLSYEKDEGLPVSFFIGLKDWKTIKESDALIKINTIFIENQLSEESLVVIFDFIKYPDNYDDPLLNIKTPKNLDKLNEWKNSGSNNGITLGVFLYLKIKLKL